MKNLSYLLILLLLAISNVSDARSPVSFDQSLHKRLAERPQIGGHALGPTDGKIVIVTFFASWCPPCRWEFKSLNALRQKYGEEELSIIAVNWFEDWDKRNMDRRMKRFLKATKPRFPLVAGHEELIAKFGGISRIPTLFVFDRSGREVYSFVHLEGATKMHAGEEELVNVIESLR